MGSTIQGGGKRRVILAERAKGLCVSLIAPASACPAGANPFGVQKPGQGVLLGRVSYLNLLTNMRVWERERIAQTLPLAREARRLSFMERRASFVSEAGVRDRLPIAAHHG